ncbi:MAG TPA: type II secretion system protein [Micavibrio sp.]
MSSAGSVGKQDGFTLVELAIVTIVSGIMTVVFASMLNMYFSGKEKNMTEEHLAMALDGINAYYINSGGIYPCPSDITLPMDDPNYGVENRNPATGQCNVTATFPAADGRDVNGNTIIDDNEKVLIGGVTYRSLSGEMIGPDVSWLEITQKDIVDGWGKQFTYVVTKGLTYTPTFDEDAGVIEIEDETSRSLLDDAGAAHAAIISHGKNGRGGYDKDGRLAQSCGGVTLPPPPPPAVTSPPSELQNCDHDDGVLLDGLHSQASFAYNDDIVRFIILKKTNLWQQVSSGITVEDPADPTKTITLPQIGAVNKGNVGIGMVDPQKTLDVMGDIQMQELRTPRVCDPTETTCIPPESIGGQVTDMDCQTPGKAVVSIEGKFDLEGKLVPSVNCANVVYAPPAADKVCASGHMVGITNLGNIICK